MGFVNYDAPSMQQHLNPANWAQNDPKYNGTLQRNAEQQSDPFMDLLRKYGLGGSGSGPIYNNQMGGASGQVGGTQSPWQGGAGGPYGAGTQSLSSGAANNWANYVPPRLGLTQPQSPVADTTGPTPATGTGGGSGLPNITAVNTPQDVFSQRMMQQRANQAAAGQVQNHSFLANQVAAPGIARSSLMPQTIAPYAQSLAARPAAYYGSKLGDATANAQNQLQGNMNRWQETLGYWNPYMDMMNTDYQNQLSGMGALGNFLYNSSGLWR